MPRELATLLETPRFRVVRVQPDLGPAREIVRHPGAVAIVPLVDDDRVCLIHNYRVSVDRTLIEIPAGTLEPGEDPRLAAERELAEETGYRAAALAPLHSFYLSPGILDERMHVFVATGLVAGEAAREPGERIENHIVPFREAIEMACDGRIHDAKTIVGLLCCQRWRLARGGRTA
jgi:ADP-ribose pyrophosphatase